tara:strand:- start:995 stop:1183 length:189 start_codon:yes stop_codon:yes gene_type:complete
VLFFALIKPVAFFIRTSFDLERPPTVPESQHILPAVGAGVIHLLIAEMDRAFRNIVIKNLVF